MGEYFPKLKSLETNVKIELNLSSNATKADLKNATGVSSSNFAKKTDLAHLKSDINKLDIDKLKNVQSGLNSLKGKVDKLDIGKIETTPVDLSKLSDVVKNEVVKKTEHNELVIKVNNNTRPKESSLVSGNQPGENFFFYYPTAEPNVCQNIYIFCFKR